MPKTESGAPFSYDGLDRVIHEKARLGLLTSLMAHPKGLGFAALKQLYDSELAHFQKSPDDAKKLATDPLGPLPAGLTEAEAAAWTVVANVLLNMDGVLTKG